MANQGNPVSDELKELAETFDTKYDDATVLIDNAPSKSYNTLVISVQGPDKDAVAHRATDIASDVRSNPTFQANDGRVTVERMTDDDADSGHEHYDVLAMIDEDL